MGILDFLGGSSNSQSNTQGIRVAPETALEKQLTGSLSGQYGQLESMIGVGAGQQDVSAATGASRSFADMLQNYSTGGFMPQQSDISAYSDLGNQIFGGQMRQQQTEAARLSARLGRPVNDPILQAKLAQQRSDVVGSFAAQQAMLAPQQRLQYAGMRADVLGGLASQAMSNRQALMQLGGNLREQDRAYRLNTGERYSNTTQTSTPSLLNTIGAVAGIAGSVGKLFGGGARRPGGEDGSAGDLASGGGAAGGIIGGSAGPRMAFGGQMLQSGDGFGGTGSGASALAGRGSYGAIAPGQGPWDAPGASSIYGPMSGNSNMGRMPWQR